MPFVQTPRGSFHFLQEGTNGPYVYFLHGLTAKSEDWGRTLRDVAAAGFQVFAFDMRGHGRSERSKEGFTPSELAEDFIACRKILGHRRVHWVGHSTGGRNALFAAACDKDAAVSLTIVDQTLRADPDSWRKYADRYQNRFPPFFRSEEELDDFLRNTFPGDERRFRYYKSQFRSSDNGEWVWTFDPHAAVEIQRLGRQKDHFEKLREVQCPILFIKGAESRYVPPEDVETMRREAPRMLLEEIPGAEHAVFQDNPEEFAEVLVEFLKARESHKISK